MPLRFTLPDGSNFFLPPMIQVHPPPLHLCSEHPGLGARPADTLCINCGQPADLEHRKNFLACPNLCFSCGSGHPGKACVNLAKQVHRWWWRERGVEGAVPGIPNAPPVLRWTKKLDIQSLTPGLMLQSLEKHPGTLRRSDQEELGNLLQNARDLGRGANTMLQVLGNLLTSVPQQAMTQDILNNVDQAVLLSSTMAKSAEALGSVVTKKLEDALTQIYSAPVRPANPTVLHVSVGPQFSATVRPGWNANIGPLVRNRGSEALVQKDIPAIPPSFKFDEEGSLIHERPAKRIRSDSHEPPEIKQEGTDEPTVSASASRCSTDYHGSLHLYHSRPHIDQAEVARSYTPAGELRDRELGQAIDDLIDNTVQTQARESLVNRSEAQSTSSHLSNENNKRAEEAFSSPKWVRPSYVDLNYGRLTPPAAEGRLDVQPVSRLKVDDGRLTLIRDKPLEEAAMNELPKEGRNKAADMF